MRKRFVFFGVALMLVVLALAINTYVLPFVSAHVAAQDEPAIRALAMVASIILVTLFLTYLVDPVFHLLFKNIPEEDMRVLTSLSRYIIMFFAMLLLFFTLVGDLGSLTVFSGLVGAGLALSLQQPLTSIAGWLIIVITKPYKIGDRISMDGIRGDVINIKMFFTYLVEFSGEGKEQETGRMLCVPNSVVLQKTVTNYTSESPYIWDEVTVSITYESDWKLAKKLVEHAAMKVVGENMAYAATHLFNSREYRLKFRDTRSVPRAYFTFAPSSVDVHVRYLVEARSKRDVASMVTEEILRAVEQSGRAFIAYPHMEIVGKPEAKVVKRRTTG
jgi:small-conductance mechanosensitive channel